MLLDMKFEFRTTVRISAWATFGSKISKSLKEQINNIYYFPCAFSGYFRMHFVIVIKKLSTTTEKSNRGSLTLFVVAV